jgi:hypothetical protein
LELILNQDLSVEKLKHSDPEISVYVVDDFLQNPQVLLDYARSNAYFGAVGADRTAYPGIRDRLPRTYERALAAIVADVYGVSNPLIHRCMLSLTTLDPSQLSTFQKIPHVDAFEENQFAAVHYLCGEPHGGTAIYRFLPRDLVKLGPDDRPVVEEMVQAVLAHPAEHAGYLSGDTSLFKQELAIEAKFNRLVMYSSNLLHCALLTAADSLARDIDKGRLSVASFFKLDATAPPPES